MGGGGGVGRGGVLEVVQVDVAEATAAVAAAVVIAAIHVAVLLLWNFCCCYLLQVCVVAVSFSYNTSPSDIKVSYLGSKCLC